MPTLGNLPEDVERYMRFGDYKIETRDIHQTMLFTANQLESFSSKFVAIAGGCVEPGRRAHFINLASILRFEAAEFRAGKHRGDIMRSRLADILAADLGGAWYSLCCAFSNCQNIGGAITEFASHQISAVRQSQLFPKPDLSRFIASFERDDGDPAR